MVAFISEDLSCIVKKKKKKVLDAFLALKYSKVMNSCICIDPSQLRLNVNSVRICDSVSNLLNSDHQLAIEMTATKFSFLPVFNLTWLH